jgi:ATPase subunit of ABC transporter with duplicated ATPase domains
MSKVKSKPFLKFHSVTFTYDNASQPLFECVSLHAAPGWTGVIGPNGTGKTTLLKLAAGLLKPDEGYIDMPRDSCYCPQRTDHAPDKLKDFIDSDTKSAQIIKKQLGIADDWFEPKRWLTLSHGERKRAQIAVALWLEPGFLAVDEPFNHLDSKARDLIANALLSFNGIGLLVSHDRELLDSLCFQCVFTDPPGLILRRGGYTQAMTALREEQHYNQKQRLLKKQAYKKLQKEALRRRELAKQSKKRLSKRGLSAKDHDAKAKIDGARLTGKDGVGGKLQRQLQGRLAQGRSQLGNIKVKKEYTMGIWLPGSVSKRDFLLELPANSLPMGKQKRLSYPALMIKPDDRIAVTGPNGVGKSTLIRHMVDSLNVPEEHIAYVPQEIDTLQSQKILDRALSLPDHQLGHLMTIISRLGSRPHRLLDSIEPSPGEMRKLLLALGMTREPHIIIMDEPTNHMDLPSIECLEQALAECPCSLILVSHDKIFLKKLTQKQWNITQDSSDSFTYVMQIY